MDEVSHLVWRCSGGQPHQPHTAGVTPTASLCRCSEDEERRCEERGWPLQQATTCSFAGTALPRWHYPWREQQLPAQGSAVLSGAAVHRHTGTLGEGSWDRFAPSH